MSCDLLHVSDEGFKRLVEEREAALQEVQVLDAENEQLRAELKQIRTERDAFEQRWRQTEAQLNAPGPWPMLPELPT